MRKLLLLPLLLFVAYLAWPLAAAWQLRSAVKARDLAGIEGRVDWPTLRANLKQTVGSNIKEKTDDPERGAFTKTLLRAIGTYATDKVIDAAVTPRTLASVLAGRSLLDEVGLTAKRGRDASAPGEAPRSTAETSEPDSDPTADPLAPRRLRWAFFESPTRFRIETVDPKLPGKRVISVLALQGVSWKLVDVYYITPPA